jgi:hypothetical protein
MRYNTKRFLVSNAFWPQREFDPANAQDLKEYKHFMEKRGWREGCPFIVEWPYLNVIDTIQDKIVRHHIDRLIAIAKK